MLIIDCANHASTTEAVIEGGSAERKRYRRSYSALSSRICRARCAQPQTPDPCSTIGGLSDYWLLQRGSDRIWHWQTTHSRRHSAVPQTGRPGSNQALDQSAGSAPGCQSQAGSWRLRDALNCIFAAMIVTAARYVFVHAWGVSIRVASVASPAHLGDGWRTLASPLDGHRRIDAVFCGADNMALGVLIEKISTGASKRSRIDVGFTLIERGSEWPCFRISRIAVARREVRETLKSRVQAIVKTEADLARRVTAAYRPRCSPPCRSCRQA